MSLDIVPGKKIVLASKSPRRHAFFNEMNIPFSVRLQEVDEVYPPHLKGAEIALYLAALKANAQKERLDENEILITSDTVVWHNGVSLAKPIDHNDAVHMLTTLSNSTHEVITAVSFTSKTKQITKSHTTEVTFKALSEQEIHYYITNYKPFDKAGGYGIQEWIGLIGITNIKGTYANVVGLPTHLVYSTLKEMVAP